METTMKISAYQYDSLYRSLMAHLETCREYNIQFDEKIH